MDYVQHQFTEFLDLNNVSASVGTFNTLCQPLTTPPFLKRTTSTANQIHVIKFAIRVPRSVGEYGTYLQSLVIPMIVNTCNLVCALHGHIRRDNLYLATTTPACALTSTSLPVTETGTSATVLSGQPRLYTATITAPAADYSTTITQATYRFQMCLYAKCLTNVSIFTPYFTYLDIR